MEASKLKEILEQHKLWIETETDVDQGQGGRAILNGADLSGISLKDANLSCAQLNGANFAYSNLTGADLEGANLVHANLNHANLTGANLRGANLHAANLRGANLNGADLEDTDLQGTDLTFASLAGANLQGASLWRANPKDAISLPNIRWVIPGCLAQLNQIYSGFYVGENKEWDNFVQDSFGLVIQNNSAEETFDIIAGDRIIRNIPDWVKYTGLKQILADSKDKTND